MRLMLSKFAQFTIRLQFNFELKSAIIILFSISVVKPMTCKIKFIINKSNGGRILKILVDVVLQDLTMQLTREQYLSVCAVTDSLNRMLISRKFISLRPQLPILSNLKGWWHYAFECVLEQRVRPYTWRRILSVRANYRLYREAYRRVLLNPNDTELKLDLQKYEDSLDIVNVVIARQHALLKLRHEQQNEEDYSGQEKSPSVKNSVWAMLPSPERAQLCKMIGYVETPTSDSGVSTGIINIYILVLTFIFRNLVCTVFILDRN